MLFQAELLVLNHLSRKHCSEALQLLVPDRRRHAAGRFLAVGPPVWICALLPAGFLPHVYLEGCNADQGVVSS